MSDRSYQLAGLFGFFISGGVFLATGIQSDDALTIIAAVTWLVGCAAWAVPVVRTRSPHPAPPDTAPSRSVR